MNTVLLVFAISAAFLLAHSLISLTRIKDAHESIGLTLLLGPLLASFASMITYQFSGQFSLLLVFLLMAGIFLMLQVVTRRSVFTMPPSPDKLITQVRLLVMPFFIINKKTILLGSIVSFITVTAFINAVWPVSDWDAVALYDFRGLLMAVDRNWNAGRELGYFYHYPPFTSLIHGLVYLGGSNASKLWYTELFIGFIFVFYSLLRRRTSEHQALVGAFLVTFSPIFSEHIVVAYTNMPYSIYFALAVLYAVEWFCTQRNQDMLWCMVCAGAASWVRQAEPFWLVLIVIIVGIKLLKKHRNSWSVLASSVCLFLGMHFYWPTYVAGLQLPTDLPGMDTTTYSSLLLPVTLGNLLLNLFQVINYLWTYLFLPQALLVAVTSTALIFDRELFNKVHIKVLTITIGVLLAMICVGTYYFSFTYRTWDLIGGSVTRMSMFLVPLLIYMLAQTVFWKPILGSDDNASLSSRKTTQK